MFPSWWRRSLAVRVMKACYDGDAQQSLSRQQRKRVTLRAALGAARQAPLTSIAIVACIAIFLGISSEPDPSSWAALAHWGVLPSNAIYDGGYWALVSSAFAH